jgi:tetratricopeptide (TPR) repeat protein
MNSSTQLCVSNFSSAYMELGNSFKNAGDFRNAYKYLNKALILSNEKTKGLCLTHLGIFYSVLALEAARKSNKATEISFYEKAIDYYTKAIEADSTLPEPYSNLAGVYNNLKQYDLAIDAAKKALKLKPNFSEAYNNLAIAFYNKGEKNAALDAMQKAVDFNPFNEMFKLNLEKIKEELK